MFDRVEVHIANYMKRYDESYDEAIDTMIEDLEAARNDSEVKEIALEYIEGLGEGGF